MKHKIKLEAYIGSSVKVDLAVTTDWQELMMSDSEFSGMRIASTVLLSYLIL